MGARRETGNWWVEVAGRLRYPCRNRVRRDFAYYVAVSGRRVKPRAERLDTRSCGHPDVFSTLAPLWMLWMIVYWTGRESCQRGDVGRSPVYSGIPVRLRGQ